MIRNNLEIDVKVKCLEEGVTQTQLEDMGMVLGGGCGTPSTTRSSGFVEKAYELGNNLRR